MTVIAANAGRYPVSAQCKALGVPRATYYRMAARPVAEKGPDPITGDVVAAWRDSDGEYGSPRIKRELAKKGICASRRRIKRIMAENGLVSAYTRARFKPQPSKPNEAPAPNILARSFDGRAPRTHIAGDLTYVRVGRKWCYVCLLVDLYNREIVGHAASARKDSDLVKAALATLRFPLTDIEVFHTDRGSEFGSAAIDEVLGVFGIERSLSRKGCPYDNAVVESCNKTLKATLVNRRSYATLDQLRRDLNRWVWRYNNVRMHSTLGYMSPVEFRRAGMSLPKSSKKV